MNDWPGRRKVERLRQWPVVEETVARIGRLEVFDGVVVLGSFADGDADELSDVDLLAVCAADRFDEAWALRERLAADALATWDSPGEPDRKLRWFKWLTRSLVKVECGIAAPGSRDLAEPVVVLLGPPSLVNGFPRVDRATISERAARRRREQAIFDPADMTPGERIDWTLAELKSAVRASRR